MRIRRVAVVMMMVSVVAGCSDPPDRHGMDRSSPPPLDDQGATVATTWFPGVDVVAPPSSLTAGALPEVVATVAWGDGGEIELTTWGSGSCPVLPTALTLTAPDEITLEARALAPDVDGPQYCTADLGPTTSVIPVPEGLDTSGPVGVVVDELRLELPARP